MRHLLVMVFGLGTVALVVVLSQQQSEERILTTKLESLRYKQRELDALRAETQTLEAAVPNAGDIRAMRDRHSEVVALRQKAAKWESASAVDPSPTPSRPPTEYRSFAAMSNAGTTRPWRTAETFFSAAASGNDDVLSSTLAVSSESREKLVAMMAAHPEITSHPPESPEMFLAHLIAKDLRSTTLTGARFAGDSYYEQGFPEGQAVSLQYYLFSPGEESRSEQQLRNQKQMTLAMTRTYAQGAEAWLITVPGAAIEKYKLQLDQEK